MNRSDFLKQLSGHLAKMSKAERDDILRDFEEYFKYALKENENEEAVCQRLGDPKKIAKEYLVQKYIEEANKEKTLKSMSKAFFSTAGLGILNFLYVLCVVVIGYILIAVLYFTVCVIGLSAIGTLAVTLVSFSMIGALAAWLFILSSLGLLALSVLGFIGIMQTAKQFRKGNMYFLNKISVSSGIKRRDNDE